MKITRITAPRFQVGRYVLNESELRMLCLEIAQGEKPANVLVTDINYGVKARINKFGGFDSDLPSLAQNTKIKFALLRYINKTNQ